MEKAAKIILLPLLVLAFLTTSFAADKKLVVYFAGEEKELIYNTDYFLRNDQLYVQARHMTPVLPFVVPAQGISWDKQTKSLIISYTGKDGFTTDRLSIQPGDSEFHDLDQTINMKSPAILSNGRMFLPLRGLSEAYKQNVHWKNEKGKSVVSINPDPAQEVDQDKQMSGAEGITDFSLKLFAESFEDENILISPLSIVSALGMVTNGAKGETLTQMEQVLNSDIDGLNDYLKAYRQDLPSGDKYKVNLANSIWFKDKESLTVNEDFLELNKDYYNASIYKTPFNEKTKDDINNWVNDQTDGMIESLLDEAPPEDAIMYLINALSFDAEWNRIYEESNIYPGKFTLENNKKQDVDFMSSSEFSYLENEKATGFMKPYKDYKYAFVALLPKEYITMSDFIGSLDGEALMGIMANETSAEVRAHIPKFSVTYDTLLNKSLQQLGMVDAFNLNQADFTGLATSTDGNIFINRVIHKTKIEVDERGTKAGAVTGVEMSTTSMKDEPKEVILNRPFFYMIVDTEQNLPLFMGSLMSVE